MENEKIPKSWGHSKLIALWKGPSKGHKNDPSTYRGIQIGSTMCKILVIIIINRLKEWYGMQLLDQQQGFRSGRGTTDGIYVIKRVQQITHKMKKQCYALFVDLTAAFDHVNRKLMFQTLSKRFPKSSSGRSLINLLESLYLHTSTALSTSPDDHFDITTGVRQGGPESPFLFNLLIDFVMRAYLMRCKKAGVKFLNLCYKIPATASKSGRSVTGTHIIDWIGYADDLALMFEDIKNLRIGLKILNSTLAEYQLKINQKKTKTMIMNFPNDKDYPDSIAHLDNLLITS